MSVRVRREGGRVGLHVGDDRVGTLILDSAVPAGETPKPYLHPLRSIGGVVVTDHRPVDHLWHHGLTFAIPRVADHNLWGGNTFVDTEIGYTELGDQGRIDVRTAVVEEDVGRCELDLVWRGHDDVSLLVERRSHVVREIGSEAWALDVDVDLEVAGEGPVELATPAQRGRVDGGYGGLFWRAARGMRLSGLATDQGEVEGPGPKGRWLRVFAESAGGDACTVVLAWRKTRDGTDGGHFIHRTEPFPAVGWAFAYETALTLEPPAHLRLGHRMLVADGHVGLNEVDELLRRGDDDAR